MDRPSDDRANFEPLSPGFDPDEAIARYLSQKSEHSGDVEPEEADEPETEPEPEHRAPFNQHVGPVLHRPVFGRKGL